MSQILVQKYFNELDLIRKTSGSLTEGVISEAFKDLLKDWARQHNLVFIAQYPIAVGKTYIKPDGAVLHDIRVPLGYWEAKDTSDDLEEEIKAKFRKGYPNDNIIFEDSDKAVLYQDGRRLLEADMQNLAELKKLVETFFAWERPAIAEFRKAVEQFKSDLPAVLERLREQIDMAYDGNAPFRKAAQKFLKQAKETINPAITEADVREMLIQHILTEEIFTHVFNDGDFHRHNNIAKELYALEEKFFTGAVKRNTLRALEPYYAAIRSNAAEITSHGEKQAFLKVIYENFYKVYNPKAADRLGVVYTPHEIVKFMIEGADYLCQKHFGKRLIDRDVEILDPATGTGTFICELLDYFRGEKGKLAHKYKEELHANEVAILPYYVANLNIEATYAAITGQYAEYPNLCFVDTLDNVAGLGIRSGHQHDLFGAMSDENVARIKRQNQRKISVVIGNPPYNANQQNENDNNKNRTYARIDQRIKDTYIAASTAQKTKLYDMYARFFRWASDRLHDDGVLAFVTNRSFIESRTFDGFRKIAAEEFAEIYVVDLGGDVRANPKLSGTKNNVFGIQTGVAISFMVHRKKKEGCKIFYARRPEMETAEDKLAWLGASAVGKLEFARITPDKNQNWLNLTDNDWDSLIPVASRRGNFGRKKKKAAIFETHAIGASTNRDDWVTDFDLKILEKKVSFFAKKYNDEIAVLSAVKRKSDKNLSNEIKWSEGLKAAIRDGRKLSKIDNFINNYHYRPYSKRFYIADARLSDRLNEVHQTSFGKTFRANTESIVFTDAGSQKPFMVGSTSALFDYHYVGAAASSAGLPRYRYTADGSRIDNITDWALKEFQKAYGRDGALSPPPSPRPDGEKVPPLAADEGQATVKSKAAKRGVKIAPHPSLRDTLSPPAGRGKKEARNNSAHDAAPAVAAKPRDLTKDAIFHYVYGVLHDPLYREKYALNLKREFPRIPFYPDFWRWSDWGERLMQLHIGYESVAPFPLARIDVADEKARKAKQSPRVILKSDPQNGVITLDSETQLTGVPREAFDYRLGNRSAIDWVLDQHKEKTPKDPTIREKFNTYRFADYKEKVIDLLMRVTTVSVETVRIVEAMRGQPR